jgi:hypothetical protein
VANGRPERLVASATLASATTLPLAALLGHVMPNFPHTLIGLGPFADQDCTIVFTQTAVIVYHADGQPILSGWQDETGPRLWHFPLTAKASDPQDATGATAPWPPIPALCFWRHHPVSCNCPHPPQQSFFRPCLWHLTLIQARASLPLTHPGLPDYFYTAQPRLLPWPPVPQVPHLTHAALISPALVPRLGSIMPAWDSWSSKLGSMLSKPATATPSRASLTSMQPSTVQMLMRQSWAILPSNAKISGRQKPSHLCRRL